MKKITTLITLVLLAISPAIYAAQHTVKLLSSGSNGQIMVMEPGFIKIAPGDSISFEPSDPSHNVVSHSIPDGAEAFATPYGKQQTITFTAEGFYVYKCQPHLPLGMVGVIEVGNATNLKQASDGLKALKAQVAMNKERIDKYLSLIKQ